VKPHDPGGKVMMPLQEGVAGWATFAGHNREHRLDLWRRWSNLEPGYALIIGMNPSTARADMDDPTVRRDIGFCRKWGYGALCKGNIASYRATSPKALDAISEPNHPMNHPGLLKLAVGAEKVILAHGNLRPNLIPLAASLTAQLREAGVKLWCFGKTGKGCPKHTLYLHGNTELEEF
jgi:hypothetical protein